MDQLLGLCPLRVVIDLDPAGVEMDFRLLDPINGLQSLLNLGYTRRAGQFLTAQ
jgi:hypothetical protein